MRKAVPVLEKIITAIFLIVFLPMLFCVCFIGNGMDYVEGYKLATVRPNFVLTLIALAALMVCGIFFARFRKYDLSKEKVLNIFTVIGLAVMSVSLYFVNLYIVKQIAFYLAWDVNVVRQCAINVSEGEDLGYFYYLSIYKNNIPISAILARLYEWEKKWDTYDGSMHLIGLRMNCAIISIAAFFCCMTVKRLTKNLFAVVLSFGLYIILIGVSPWKMAEYTDTYAMAFPVMGIYFYLCYRDVSAIWKRILFITLSLLALIAGGVIKPSVYVIVIAIFCIEILELIREHRKHWLYLVYGTGIFLLLLWGGRQWTQSQITYLGLDYNEELNAGWQYYLYLGQNEETMGNYSSDDAALFGEFQTSAQERNRVALERALNRIEEKGITGNLYFWLRKLVMAFNDGSFGWRSDVWIGSYCPEELADNTSLTEWLRNIFWPERNVGRINTIWQLTWIFCLLGIPGVCVPHKGTWNSMVWIVSLLGILMYLVLFECRARYLFVFLPMLIPTAVCGMQQEAVYLEMTLKKLHRRKKEANA